MGPPDSGRRRGSGEKLAARGHSFGEKHYGAKLTRRMVDLVLELREEHGHGYRTLQGYLWDWHGIALSVRTIRGICNYDRWLEPIDLPERGAPVHRIRRKGV